MARPDDDDAERVTTRRPRRETSLPPRPRLRRPAHSGFGVASVALGAAAIVLEVLMLGLYLAAGLPADVAQVDRTEPLVAFIACSQWGGLGLCVVALAFGVAGLFQTGRGKVFPVLGIGLGLALVAMMCGSFLFTYVLPGLVG